MNTLKNLLLLCFGLVIAIFLSELVIRYVAPQQMYRFPKGLFVSDQLLGYSQTPDFYGISHTVEFKTHIQTNSLGLRENREYGTKPGNTYRILALGDSFTMGVGVDHDKTFVKVLEELLSTENEIKRFEVINAGVPGYNTAQELQYLTSKGLLIEPDMVLLNFYIGNDLHDNFYDQRPIVVDGFLVSAPPPEGLLPPLFRNILHRYSHLYNFIWPYQRMIRNPELRKHDEKKLHDFMSIYATKNDKQDNLFWDSTLRLLDKFKAATQQYSFKAAVILIPDPLQVSDPKWKDLVQRLSDSQSNHERKMPNSKIVAYCQKIGLPVLDLLPVFSQRGDTENLYFDIDGHFTSQGNMLAAKTINAYLNSQKMLTGIHTAEK